MFRKVANFNYFDNINSPEKAYWLGFIWADGYIAKRERPRKTGSTRLEYNLKLALKKEDSEHLEKFINCLESDYEIHHYKTKGFGMTECIECRIFITNVHMCGLLYEKLGIFPHRYDVSILIEYIPEEYHKYFILGIFDGDGSLSCYEGSYGKKLNVTFGGSKEVLVFIENHLIKNHIIDSYKEGRKFYQRHKGGDGRWLTLGFAGVPQGMKILNYLYDSPIYLNRKYEKYKNLPYFNQ